MGKKQVRTTHICGTLQRWMPSPICEPAVHACIGNCFLGIHQPDIVGCNICCLYPLQLGGVSHAGVCTSGQGEEGATKLRIQDDSECSSMSFCLRRGAKVITSCRGIIQQGLS